MIKRFLISIITVLLLAHNSYALNIVQLNPEYFPDPSRGRPVSLGYIYVGEPDTDPEVVGNQKQMSVQQEDGTVVEVSQPLRTNAGGTPDYNGSPVTILVDGDYSLKLLNSGGSQVYYTPSDINLTNENKLSKFACDIAAAVAGAPTETVIVDCEFTVASGTTVTIPSTMTVQYIRGGKGIGVAGDGTETLAYANGTSQPIAPWNQQIYGDDLTVTYGTSILEAFPEHFGNIDGTSDEVQINLAITALNKGDVALNGQSYTVDASIEGKTNVNLRGREGITTINIGTADINAFYADTKTNITISGIKWNGSGANADTERLVFFDTCTDVHSRNNIYTNSIIGLQFQTCTRGSSVNDTFTAILRKTDFSEGYGVLANLNNDDIKVLHGSFNAVGRHCVYFTSGSSNVIAAHNTAVDCTGAPFDANSATTDNTMRNVQFTNNIINGIQTAGGADDVFGFIISGNIDGFIISNNQLYDNDVGGGILVQSSSTDTNTAKSGVIDNNLIDTVDGDHAIQILNASKIQITNNQTKAVDVVGGTKSSLNVNVSGAGTGSAVDEILIENNIFDTGKYGINISGTDATHKATNIILGDNQITNSVTADYNMGTMAYITYKTKWESWVPTYYLDNAAANQTDTVITPTHAGAYAVWIAPFTGRLYSAWGRVNGTITDDSITFEIRKNGSNFTSGVTISAGDLYEKQLFNLGFAVTEGDWVEMIYTTPAGFLPDGSRDVIAGFEIIREISK